MKDRLARLVPARLARFGIPLMVLLVGAILLAGVAVAALVSPGAMGLTAARVSKTTDLDGVLASGLSEIDTDRDGLSDSLENYLYGTDPEDWDSSGLGIPDGWLVQYGFDPLDPLVKEARGAAPDPEKLPAAYASGYPAEYTPPLSAYYAYAKPESYQPGRDAPWWRAGDHADPVAPDQTGTGIPTGWLLRYGLPLRDLQVDRVAPGSLGNLTIREAWEAGTDPLALDSDADGLDDWTEMRVTLTSPARFSTSGAGIADGWLLRFGLNAFDADVGTQDPDRDGLTNLEEFTISQRAFGLDFAKGLNPLEWQTAGTGIPDGWYVRYGLSPFGADVDRVIGRASDFAEYRDDVPEGQAPLPDVTFTVRGAYEYARPSDWNESQDGVWWGGTNPVTLDSDADGLTDPVEIRGWYANATFDTGPEAKPRVYLATSNPLEGDSDGDGLSDLEEYRGRALCDAKTASEREFPPTDPRNRDTAFSGLSDYEKVCGIVRGDAKYDLLKDARAGAPTLDPTRADSAGDHLKDGARLDFWHERYDDYRANPRYPYNGSAYRTLFEWTEEYARFASLSREQTLAQFRPDGDVDGDGVANLLDADPSGGLHVEKWGAPGDAKTKIFFPAGPEIDPSIYRLTEFASVVPHSASDPANPDTDGDSLPDAWEIRYGRFSPAANGWDLDPSKADSDGDGVTDDKGNNDGDVVTWYSYDPRGAVNERTTHTFAFTNDLELLAGTDPNAVSTADDGVPDGWKAFWGTRITSGTYPNLLASRDPSVGRLALEGGQIEKIEAAIGELRIAPSENLRGLGSKATGYVRFVNVSGCASLAELESQLKPGEQLPRERACFADRDLEGNALKVGRILGVRALTYADESKLRTNPYMQDTDGDGAPDAYEAYFLVRSPGGTAHPDPVADDSAKDPDGDGLRLRDECASADGVACGVETFLDADGTTRRGAGADPNRADSDADGIQDGIEVTALISPLDPSDVESFANANKDADQDGLADFKELTGKDSKAIYGEAVRTSPNDADTDGDGLIDGETRTLERVRDAQLLSAWLARGYAHRILPNGSVDFLGERTFGQPFGLRPDVLDSALRGVPDGWLAYYGLNPKETTVDKAAYEARRPAWWNEATHGVWWWGDDPAADAPIDADGDGLHDANGEDPFPAMSRANRVVSGNVTVTDLKALQAYVAAAGNASAQRLRAQGVGEGAGDPVAARAAGQGATNPSTNVLLRDDRACVQIIDVVAPANVSKGVPFNVSGRVVLDERDLGCGNGRLLEGSETARVGLANRTVLVSVFTPSAERVVGAGFTSANGSFQFPANLATDVRVTIPAPGLALLGATQGAVAARFDPGIVSAGNATAGEPNTLVVWTYNTSANAQPGAPTYEVHRARLPDANGIVAERSTNATRFGVSAPVPITVRAATRIDFQLPEAVVNGERLLGEVRLLDAGGAGVADKPLTLRWTGVSPDLELRSVFTDRTGRVNLSALQVFAGLERVDQKALTVTFQSTDPNLLPSAGSFPVRVRNPVALTGEPDRNATIVGETIVVSGNLTTRAVRLQDGRDVPAQPLGGATVVASLGGAQETVTTDGSGRFSARLAVPGSLAAGAQVLELRYAGDATNAPANATLPLAIKRTASIEGLNRLEGPRGIEVTLRGTLLDNEGQGISGRIDVVNEKVGLLARGTSREDGTFALGVPLGTLQLGVNPLVVVFAGDQNHAAAQNATQARVTTSTALRIDRAPDLVVRGATFGFRATLVDDKGKPVAGQPLAGTWRGERLEVLVTSADGSVSFLVPGNASERPSLAQVGVEYSPAGNSVYQPATAAASVRVVAGSALEVAPGVVARGPVSVTGRLLDDEGRPIPGSLVTLALDGAPLGEARTTRNGSFQLDRILPAGTPLGAHAVRASYAGTPTLAAANATAAWQMRSPVVLQLTTLGPFVRGESAEIVGRAVDDEGQPVDGAFRALLGERDLGAFSATRGEIRAVLAVPDDVARGPATLRLAAPASERYDALDRTYDVVVKIRPKIEVELPALAVRGFALAGDVTLKDDQGEPLRNTSFAYVLGSGRGAVTGTTDAEGRATLASVAPVTGDAVLALSVRGGADVLGTEYRTSSLRVVGPATPIGYASLAIVLVAALLLVAIVVAAILLRRRQLAEAREILEDAIRDLLAGNEYAGTVFLAYRRFGAYLSRHGYVEKASETPREFALGVRKALPIGAAPLRQLIGVFEEARYSDHAIGSVERDRAIEALAGVRNELDRILGGKKVSA